jgi:hypothetical protein
MIRPLAFIVLSVLEAFMGMIACLAPSLFIGPMWLCELALDRLRLPPLPDRSTDLRVVYPVSV